MNEIEKMYENAGVETNKYKLCCTGCKHIAKLEVINGYPSKWICDKYDEVADCDSAEPEYPPFTAEKQIELIKWLMNKSFSYSTVEDKDGIKYWFEIDYETSSHGFKNFEETIADTINEMWQDLIEEERTQIKEILE